MSTTTDYNSLRTQRNNKQLEYDQTKRRIARYEERLERLKPVKREISELKDVFSLRVKLQDHYNINSRSWKGTKYDRLLDFADQIDEENRTYFFDSMDYVLDALNSEITRLENLCLKEYGLLGKLLSAINSLTTMIENEFN